MFISLYAFIHASMCEHVQACVSKHSPAGAHAGMLEHEDSEMQWNI